MSRINTKVETANQDNSTLIPTELGNGNQGQHRGFKIRSRVKAGTSVDGKPDETTSDSQTYTVAMPKSWG